MRVYADNAATTAMSPAAKAAMLPYLDEIFGNPSSPHSFGQAAAEALEQARECVASCLNAAAREIYFTSGGSEADNQAIRSAALDGAKKGRKHIISSKFEHHAVLHTLKKLEQEGFEVQLLDVYDNGMVRVEDVKAAIRPDTALVTIMFANNEIGTVQPIREIGAACRSAGVPFHTDAVQAAGHLAIDVQTMNIDLLSLSGHKFHGPKSVGALYVRRGSVPLTSLIEGGAQGRGKRAGTENLPGIVGMAAALREACERMEEDQKKVSAMRDQLIEGLKKIPMARLNGDRTHRLPGNVNFSFPGIEGEGMLLLLDSMGIAASSGSACTSGSLDPSHVLLAIGLPHEIAHGSLRISLSAYNTQEEMNRILTAVPQVVERLRAMSPVWKRMKKECA